MATARTGMRIKTKWLVPPVMIESKHRAALTDALDRTAIQINNDIVDSLSTGFPPASGPGEPPHVRTGHLRRSVGWERVRDLARAVGTGIKGAAGDAGYAMWLEFGTSAHTIPVGKKGFLAWRQDGTRKGGTLKKGDWVFTRKAIEQKGMAARPFLRPALRKNVNLLADTVKRIMAAMRLSSMRA